MAVEDRMLSSISKPSFLGSLQILLTVVPKPKHFLIPDIVYFLPAVIFNVNLIIVRSAFQICIVSRLQYNCVP